MSRVNYRFVIYYFLMYVVLQLPLLYKLILFEDAFGFFYIGFLLFLPIGINPFVRMIIGFLTGLLIDIFSNTPGLHASACTLIMFIRDYWFLIVHGDPEDDPNISIYRLGFSGSIYYLLPLVFIHLIWIFTIEHGKWQYFLGVLNTTFWSTLFTFLCIAIFNFAFIQKPARM